MDPSEFRRHAHALVDWIADYRERMGRLPVMSRIEPGAVAALFPRSPPAEGGKVAEALAALDGILPGITHWNHPAFFAYFPSNTSLASVLGDLAAAGLGVQGMSWQTSPAATELEQVVMDWLRQMVGLPEAFHGVVQDTASVGVLTALLCARERTSRFAQNGKGLQDGAPRPMTVYASDQAHSSVQKAALLAGFGSDHVRLVATDDAHALRLDLLERAMGDDATRGLRPCAVVATTGTTATTALDPVGGMAALAERHRAWLHVDAALAGTAMVLPECRAMWAGVERADSVVFNPHKWMGIGFDFSAFYVRDPEHLVRVMSTNPSYLATQHDGRVTNFRDWGIPLGRRFRALKGWLHLVDEGVSAMQARIRRDLANARWLADEVDRAPGWERLAPVPLQTVCVRHLASGERDEARLASHNLSIAARVNGSGKAYVTPAVLKGKQMIRVSVGATATERKDVELVWRELKEAAVGHG